MNKLKHALHGNNIPMVLILVEQNIDDLEWLSQSHPTLNSYAQLLIGETQHYADHSSFLTSGEREKTLSDMQKTIVQIKDIAHQVMDRIHLLSEEKLIREKTGSESVSDSPGF